MHNIYQFNSEVQDFKNNQEVKNSKSLISRVLKSRDRNLDYSFTNVKVNVGHKEELVQHQDSLTYMEEEGF